MVLLETQEAFLTELTRMYDTCKEHGAGSVYITMKSTTSKEDGTQKCLVRAKLSNKKQRKISVYLLSEEQEDFHVLLAGIMGKNMEAPAPQKKPKRKKSKGGRA